MSVKCHLCGQRRTDDTNGGGVCRCAGGYSAYHDIQKKADAFDDELRFQREIANLRHDIERHVCIATEATQEVEQLRAELAASQAECERFKQRERNCLSMGEAQKISIIRALQECCDALGIDSESSSPADIVAAARSKTAECERLRADAERLDYIERNCRRDPKMDGNHVWWPTNFNHRLIGPTLRAAIDAARAGKGE